MPKLVVPLREASLVNARPREKDYTLFDGDGLFLLVKANGTKSWRFKYKKPDGKAGLTAFGDYPALTLAGARARREEARALLQAGIDPVSHKRQQVTELNIKARNSFTQVAKEWHAAAAAKWSEDHAATIMRRLEHNLFPRMGSTPLDKFKTRDLLSVLVGIESRSAEVASRCQQYIVNIFRFGVQRGYLEVNPALDLVGAIVVPDGDHRPALNLERTPELLQRIDTYRGRAVTRYALKIMLRVFLRSSELRFSRWSEFDLKRAMWLVPETREKVEGVKHSGRGAKMKTEHLVPLSRQVVQLLTELRELTGAFEFVFPGDHNHWKSISENTVNRALRLMGYDTKVDVCGHGFRTMACSAMLESGLFSKDAIERQMSHQERDKVRAAYIHKAEFLQQRREMMQWWSDYLDEIQDGFVPAYSFKQKT